MKIQEAAENYLECILIIEKEKGQVRSIDIVNEMGYSKPSISVAMKRLRENGYIDMDEEGFITLNPSGKAIAERIYARHRWLTKFLVTLGVSEKTAAIDACKMEHDLSDETFECIKAHALASNREVAKAAETEESGA